MQNVFQIMDNEMWINQANFQAYQSQRKPGHLNVKSF